VGNVGQLPDVQLFSVPKVEWDSRQQDILSFLKGSEGVQKSGRPVTERRDPNEMSCDSTERRFYLLLSPLYVGRKLTQQAG
jgi:hypothetical protein